MSALVKTIKSRLTDDTIYPVTKADAVYMGSSTATTVEGQINSINNIIGSETMGTTATTITGAIAELNMNLMTVDNVTSSSLSIPGNTTTQRLFDVTKTGWIPVGVVGLDCDTGAYQNNLLLYSYHIYEGNESLLLGFKNLTSNDATVTVTATVLYVKA